jgi:hypothetical protein
MLWQLLAGTLVMKLQAGDHTELQPRAEQIPRRRRCLGRRHAGITHVARTSHTGIAPPTLTIILPQKGLVLETCTASTRMHQARTYHTNNCARFNAFGQGKPHRQQQATQATGHTGQRQATQAKNAGGHTGRRQNCFHTAFQPDVR